MKIIFIVTIINSIFLLMPGGLKSLSEAQQERENIRNAILAGSWYPGNKDALTKRIEGYLSKVKAGSLEGELKAIIVPHAGYMYSGQVAAHAYQLLQDRDFKRVIMIGPSHRVGFRGASVNMQSGYKTPLGIVPVDRDLGKRILNGDDFLQGVPRAHASEHSLEIQLPFLQTVLKDFQIVPILMGDQDLKTCAHLARSLARVMTNMDRILLLASTDLSHFHRYERAKELDLKFIKHVREFDPKGLADSLSSGKCEACGRGPAITVMLAAQALGANRAVILNYANSGDVTGDHGRVVGYLSAALIRASGRGPHPQ
ncbi:MAG: AmmeMemoRadiSam system protein B [Desulfobacteraceae bacterium]|nr:AmmeMemoRadiSam system protein B [Desulfobacteraceae bacterium]